VFFSFYYSNAQTFKRLATNAGYGTHGPFIGLYYTQPISQKIALSLSVAYSAPGDLTFAGFSSTQMSYEMDIIKLDVSYRISQNIPINFYAGYGFDAYNGSEYITPLGVSFAKRSLVFYGEITSFYLDYEYMYSETYVSGWSTWTEEFYYYTETNFTGLNIGLRYYFK
tara:strand:+ start:138 stop:641 length:504 start_codon:yes stop_codon:yes gene_type:complete